MAHLPRLSGWSVQYASATGAGFFGSNPITALSGTLQPGQYYLVQLAGGTTGAALPPPDATGTANMSGTGGKVALVNTTTGLACNGSAGQPCSSAQLTQIVDLVGYGAGSTTIANFYEGAGPAPAANTTIAVFATTAAVPILTTMLPTSLLPRLLRATQRRRSVHVLRLL